MKDVLLVMSPATLDDSVTNLTVRALLYVGNALLTMVALPCTDNFSNVIDVILSCCYPGINAECPLRLCCASSVHLRKVSRSTVL